MAMRRAKNMRRRYNRKGQKKARILRAPAAKKYTYEFNLLPQLLVVNTTTGLAEFSPATGAGQLPFTNAATQIQQYSSATNFSNVSDIALSTVFKLQDLSNFATFAAIYDAYKINSITMVIEYLNNSSQVDQRGFMPTLYVYNDQDDAIVPPDLKSLVGKTGYKTFQFGNHSRTKFSYKFRPTVSQALLTSPSGTFPSGIGKSQWINCAGLGQTINHYALKVWISDLATLVGSSQSAFRIAWKYNISFRSPLTAV